MYVTFFFKQEPIDKIGWVLQISSLDRLIKYLLYAGANDMGDQWELYNQGYIGGPMRWGTNESMVGKVTRGGGGTNEMGDQWELCNQGRIGGPMRWGTNENRVDGVRLGDQWDGGPMRTI